VFMVDVVGDEVSKERKLKGKGRNGRNKGPKMKKALLVPLLVVALAVGLTAFHANFLSNDRVDWYYL
jgi:hypothetical protein